MMDPTAASDAANEFQAWATGGGMTVGGLAVSFIAKWLFGLISDLRDFVKEVRADLKAHWKAEESALDRVVCYIDKQEEAAAIESKVEKRVRELTPPPVAVETVYQQMKKRPT